MGTASAMQLSLALIVALAVVVGAIVVHFRAERRKSERLHRYAALIGVRRMRGETDAELRARLSRILRGAGR